MGHAQDEQRWTTAVRTADALCPHDARVLVRWVVAEQWAGFVPQGAGQRSTRKLVQQHAAAVLEWMAHVVPQSGRPNHIEHAATYDAAVHAAQALGTASRRSLLRHVFDGWRRTHGDTEEAALARDGLVLCLQDMEAQHSANARGWVCEEAAAPQPPTAAPAGATHARRKRGKPSAHP